MPKPSDWLLVIMLPSMFLILAIGLFLVMRKVFRESDEAARNPIPTSAPASNTRLLWLGLGLGMVAVTFALGALLLVAWNVRRS